jgi:NTE family protein
VRKDEDSDLKKGFLIPLIFFVFIGCAQVEGPHERPSKPAEAQKRKKVALVLGGGGARGFAHVGVIRELEASKIPIDLIVGVSVGSLIGALYADSGDSFDLEWKAFKIEKKEIFDFTFLNITNSLARGEAIKAYLDRHLKVKNIEQLKIPLAIVAVDLKTGQRELITSGSIRDAVRASTSVPGIFEPVPYKGKLLVDGGVLGNLPDVARSLGADFVIGVNISKKRSDLSRETPGILTVILESISIMGEEIVRLNRERFDVLIEPDCGDIGLTDFTRKRELIDAGRRAAKRAIPIIKEKLEKI